MRIAFISHWFDPEGGAAAGPGTVARALSERGHDIHVVTGFPIYPKGEVFDGYRIRPYVRESIDGLTVHRFAIYPSHDSSAAKRFANYASYAVSGGLGAPFALPRVDCGFVYSTPATAALPGLTLRAVRRVPFVVHIQDLWPQTVTASGMLGPRTSSWTDRLLNPFCDFVYRSAHRVAVTSPGMADHIATRGIPRRKLTVLPNWADEQSFHPAPRNPKLAAAFNLSASTVIMYAGNLGVMQNLEVVISAAERLHDVPNLQFAFVGAGVMADALRRMVDERQLTNVIFIPAQPFERMSEILALGDAQLVTLKDEPLFRSTTPSKLQANLAAGRPIIGAVAGDAASVIERSGAGIVALPGDPDALAAAIRRFAFMPPTERGRLSQQALAHYAREFSRETVVASLERLMVEAAGGQES